MKWVHSWLPVEDNLLAEELHRELALDHPLFGVPVVALARRCDCDDVLFALQDGTARVAVVHLIWGTPGCMSNAAQIAYYDTFNDWVARDMSQWDDGEDPPDNQVPG